METIEATMGYYLVGTFLGRFPGWKALKELTKRWNTPQKMFTAIPYGWFLSLTQRKDHVLQAGPHISYNYPLYLKVMPPYFYFQPDTQNNIPLWIQIYGLPIDCWTVSGLRKLASKVGVPFFLASIRYSSLRPN